MRIGNSESESNDYVEVPRSNLMSEDKQGKMDRRKMYEQLSDATRFLASHKDISQHRRESLRPAFNKDCRVICTTQQYAKLTSNEFLFGVDLSKHADEALKAKRLAYKLAGSTRVVQFKMTLGLPFENEATHRKMFIPNTTLKFT